MTSATLATKFMMSLLLLALFMEIIHAMNNNQFDAFENENRRERNRNKKQRKKDKSKLKNLEKRMYKNDLENTIDEAVTDNEISNLKKRMDEMEYEMKDIEYDVETNGDKIDDLKDKDEFPEFEKYETKESIQEELDYAFLNDETEDEWWGLRAGEDATCEYDHANAVEYSCKCLNLRYHVTMTCDKGMFCLPRHDGIVSNVSGIEMEQLKEENEDLYWGIIYEIEQKMKSESNDGQEYFDANDGSDMSYYATFKLNAKIKYNVAKQAAKEAYENLTWENTQEKAKKAWEYTKDGYQYGKEKVGAGYQWTKEKAGKGWNKFKDFGNKYFVLNIVKVVLNGVEMVYNKMPEEYQDKVDTKIVTMCNLKFGNPICGGSNKLPQMKIAVIMWVKLDGYKTYKCEGECKRQMNEYVKKEGDQMKNEMRERMGEEEYAKFEKMAETFMG